MLNCQITLLMGDLAVFSAFLNYFFFISEIQAARENQDANILGKYQLIVFKHIFQNLRVTKQVCMQTYLFSYLSFFLVFLDPPPPL